MNPKYQIFVSSTYDDLKEEREQVIKAILEMGHIPVGMEMFSAADEEQWKIIQRQIDSSDYYVVIVAHRYGSIVDGISYTEKEYDYAITQEIPTLGFVIDKGAVWPHEKFDSETKKKKSLELFKAKIKKKPVQFWTTKKDLYGQVAIALGKTFNTQPRPGWVRSDSTTGPAVSEEIARLSRENAELRELSKNITNPFTTLNQKINFEIQINRVVSSTRTKYSTTALHILSLLYNKENILLERNKAREIISDEISKYCKSKLGERDVSILDFESGYMEFLTICNECNIIDYHEDEISLNEKGIDLAKKSLILIQETYGKI